MIILLLLFLLVPKTEPVAIPVVPVVEAVQTEQATESQLTSPSDVPETKTPIQTQARSVKPLEQPLNSSQSTEQTPIEAPIETAEPITPTFPPGTCTTCSYKINVGDKPTTYELEQLRKYQEQDYQ